jgi:hypothetical protein
MISYFLRLSSLAVILFGGAVFAYSQAPLMLPDASTRGPGRARDDERPRGYKEMLAKQRAEREKKEHEEMLERGEEALRIAKQLETAFDQNKGFSSQDKERLESLEKVVTKIRKELGGDDDDEPGAMKPVDEPKPSTMEEAFRFLQSTTVKLVDELKKTTRFSISVIAIQSSNNVLKLIRFLRLRK